jgi:hypothetical protein
MVIAAPRSATRFARGRGSSKAELERLVAEERPETRRPVGSFGRQINDRAHLDAAEASRKVTERNIVLCDGLAEELVML